VEAIEKIGGVVTYDWQYNSSGDFLNTAQPPVAAWPRSIVGDDFFASAYGVGLAGTKVTDAGLKSLCGLPALQSLSLRDTEVTDAGLANLRGLTALQCLGLSWTQVTDAGLEGLRGLTALKVLSLYDTRVTDAGVKRLQQALPDCDLQR
jgi:hypothetical protein